MRVNKPVASTSRGGRQVARFLPQSQGKYVMGAGKAKEFRANSYTNQVKAIFADTATSK